MTDKSKYIILNILFLEIIIGNDIPRAISMPFGCACVDVGCGGVRVVSGVGHGVGCAVVACVVSAEGGDGVPPPVAPIALLVVHALTP